MRGLKTLVAGLGVLVVLGTATVIGVVIKRIYADPQPASTAAAAVPARLDNVVALPAGTKITGLAAAGGRFAVAVSGPAGDQVWIVDPATGARYVTISAAK